MGSQGLAECSLTFGKNFVRRGISSGRQAVTIESKTIHMKNIAAIIRHSLCILSIP